MPEGKVVVIGFGSLHGDDQAGWLVIDALKKIDAVASRIILFKSKADGVDWYPVVDNANLVIFVDAVTSGSVAGTIHRVSSESQQGDGFSTSTHSINIMQSIEMAKTLDYLSGKIEFYGLEIASTDSLSAEMGNAIDLLVDELVENVVK